MKEKKYLILGIITSILILMGASYAYFTTRIEGNRKSVTIDMSELKIVFTNGDAIEASDVYAEDNLDIVKTFSVENKTKNEYKYNIVIEDLVNTFKTTGYLVYKITSDDGGYNMTEFEDVPKGNNNDIGLAFNVSINANSIHNYNIEIKYINDEENSQDEDQGAKLSGKLYITKGSNPDLLSKILTDNPVMKERTDFSVTNTENTTGTIYKTNKTEDDSYVYYYSGNTTNNWVKFGKETRTSCTYNDVEVYYENNTTNVSKDPGKLTEEECVSTNVCTYNDNFYVVGLSESECTSNSNVYSSDKATYNGSSLKDVYWRIIRTNEDGSVRMLYSGLDPATTEGYIGKNDFNLSYNDPICAGYMYGTSGSLANNRTNENDSAMKVYVDTWYENNLLTSYDKYISKTAIYCNDRSESNGNYVIGYSRDGFVFDGYTRLKNYTPTYKCGGDGNGGLFEVTQAIADKFSASTTGGGNGLLKYPIALMTADEISFAGGKIGAELSSPYAWYYNNSKNKSIIGNNSWDTFITMTPLDYAGVDPASSNCSMFVLSTDTTFTSVNAFGGSFVRPSLSLDKFVQIKSGNGTPESPYEIDENSCG